MDFGSTWKWITICKLKDGDRNGCISWMLEKRWAFLLFLSVSLLQSFIGTDTKDKSLYDIEVNLRQRGNEEMGTLDQ